MQKKKEILFPPKFTIINILNLSEEDKKLFTPKPAPFMEPWKIAKKEDLVICAKKAVKEVIGKEANLICGKSNADENYIGLAEK